MRPREHPRGFTLLEILVVLVLTGILLNGARIATGRLWVDPEHEAERLLALMELAADEAVMRNRAIGLQVHRDPSAGPRYRIAWARRIEGRWHALDTAPFETRWLPEGIELELAIEGSVQRIPDHIPREPQLRFFASGESDPYRLVLRLGEEASGFGSRDGLQSRPEPTSDAP